MAKSEERIQNIKEYILEFQFIYHRTPTYDDQIVRQILQCVVVESKQKIKVVFIGGLEVECDVEQA